MRLDRRSELEVRLARARGSLSSVANNWFQDWALVYCMSLDLWDADDEREAFLARQTYIQNPERYMDVFLDEEVATVFGELGEMEEMPISPEEFDSIEQWFEQADAVRSTTAADLAFDDERGWQ